MRRDIIGAGRPGRIVSAAMCPTLLLPAVVGIMMLLGDWEHDPEDDSRRKWKHKELGQPIKWTGPLVSPQSPRKTVLRLSQRKLK